MIIDDKKMAISMFVYCSMCTYMTISQLKRHANSKVFWKPVRFFSNNEANGRELYKHLANVPYCKSIQRKSFSIQKIFRTRCDACVI